MDQIEINRFELKLVKRFSDGLLNAFAFTTRPFRCDPKVLSSKSALFNGLANLGFVAVCLRRINVIEAALQSLSDF